MLSLMASGQKYDDGDLTNPVLPPTPTNWAGSRHSKFQLIQRTNDGFSAMREDGSNVRVEGEEGLSSLCVAPPPPGTKTLQRYLGAHCETPIRRPQMLQLIFLGIYLHYRLEDAE